MNNVFSNLLALRHTRIGVVKYYRNNHTFFVRPPTTFFFPSKDVNEVAVIHKPKRPKSLASVLVYIWNELKWVWIATESMSVRDGHLTEFLCWRRKVVVFFSCIIYLLGWDNPSLIVLNSFCWQSWIVKNHTARVDEAQLPIAAIVALLLAANYLRLNQQRPVHSVFALNASKHDLSTILSTPNNRFKPIPNVDSTDNTTVKMSNSCRQNRIDHSFSCFFFFSAQQKKCWV